MSPKTFEQGTTLESVRDIYRRLNDYASVGHTFTNANTQASITHALGRPPRGWEIIRTNKPVEVYSSASVLGTRSLIRLSADNSNVAVVLRVF